jgi:hypothetical protein
MIGVFKNATMIRFLLLVGLACFALAQPLDPVQHNTLMNIYDALGSLISSHSVIVVVKCFVWFVVRMRLVALPEIQCFVGLYWWS